MSRLKFTAEMFKAKGNPDYVFDADWVTMMAQAIYDKHVEGLPTIVLHKYADNLSAIANLNSLPEGAHTARLEAVEAIEEGKK